MPNPYNAESWNAVALKPSRVRNAAIAIPSALPVLNCSYIIHREKKANSFQPPKRYQNPVHFLNSIFYAELQNGP